MTEPHRLLGVEDYHEVVHAAQAQVLAGVRYLDGAAQYPGLVESVATLALLELVDYMQENDLVFARAEPPVGVTG